MRAFLSLATLPLLIAVTFGCATQRRFMAEGRSRRSADLSANSSGRASEKESATLPARLARYAKARGKDFLDIPRLGVGGGVGAHADVEATMLLHFGLGSAMTILGGLNNGFPGSIEIFGGVPLTNVRIAREDGWPGAFVCHHHSLFTYALIGEHPYENIHTAKSDFPQFQSSLIPLFLTYNEGRFGTPLIADDVRVYHPIRWADVEAGATIIPLSCRVGASPGEALDFIVGWFGLDLSGDDRRPWFDRRGWMDW